MSWGGREGERARSVWAVDAPARPADFDERPEAVYGRMVVLVQDGRDIVCGEDLFGFLKRFPFVCLGRSPDKRGEVGQHCGPTRGRGSRAPDDEGIWVVTPVKGEITQQGAGMESEPWESQAPSVEGACVVRGCVRGSPKALNNARERIALLGSPLAGPDPRRVFLHQPVHVEPQDS